MQALVVTTPTLEYDIHDLPLCEVYALRSLQFTGVALGVAELNALSTGLADPHTRRVDGLSLEKTLLFASSPNYVPALQRVFIAALQAKHSHTSSCCPGLKLSLAENEHIQPAHVEALQEALTVATRPLTGLRLASNAGGDVGTWLRLGDILFIPCRIPYAKVCELDLSMIQNVPQAVEMLSISLTSAVARLIPRVRAALSASMAVRCRVSDASLGLPLQETYEVVDARFRPESLTECVLVSTPSTPKTSTWVSSSAINYLRIGDEDLVRCRFTRLVMHGASTHHNEAMYRFAQRCGGSSLEQLSLSTLYARASFLPGILDSCPNLQAIDLPELDFYDQGEIEAWDRMLHKPLQVINVRNSRLSAASVTHLLSSLLGAPHKTMRYLDLWGGNGFDMKTLDVLFELLKENRSLVIVEMPSVKLRDDRPQEAALRLKLQAIDACLHAEYVSPEMQMALLGVIRHRNHLHFDENIARNVFEFTGSVQKRVVRWNRRQPNE